MTRRQLAKRLSTDIRSRGPHYINGSMVWCTPEGWGAYTGNLPPHPDSIFYSLIGWDMHATRNTTDKVDAILFRLEKERKGINKFTTKRHVKGLT